MWLANYIYKEDFLNKEECNNLINEGKKDLNKAFINDRNGTQIKNLIRETNVNFFRNGSSVDIILEKVIDSIGRIALDHYGVPITAIESIQYAEYETGMFYDWHTDSGFGLKQPRKRDISASLILNDKSEYTGGSLQMILAGNISKDNIVTPKDVENQEKGTLIVFPSLMIHRVTPVFSGVRKSLVLWSSSNLRTV